MDFPTRILELKKEKNLLQKDIANASGVTVRNYQRYEKGEAQPTLPVLLKLADYFNVSLDYLVGRSDDPTRH
jgi:transcriptional regulator with XRE-family HTH domain